MSAFQCLRVGRAVTSGNKSKSKSPSMLLRLLPPVEVRVRRWPKTDMPGRFMMVLLVRRRVRSESELEAEAASSAFGFIVLDGNRLGRSAAGMYTGRTWRAW